MNWKRGGLRVWVVICVLWPLALLACRAKWQIRATSDYDFTEPAHLALLLAPVLASLVVAIVVKTGLWVYRGFVE